IDLDACRHEDGTIEPWAMEIIEALDTYCEVSPSETGVKLFCYANIGKGRKKEISNAPKINGRMPAIELYQDGRYFAVTGWRVPGNPAEPQCRQAEIDALIAKLWPSPPPPPPSRRPPPRRPDEPDVLLRASRYLSAVEPAIEGSGGDKKTVYAACILVLGFGLSQQQAFDLLWNEYNPRCQPPWTEKELWQKVRCADKQPGEREYLSNVRQDQWQSVKIPDYSPPPPQPELKAITLADAARSYIKAVQSGGTNLLELGLPEVDKSLGGGVARSEMVILAARPSHGKSAAALQCIHHWTSKGIPCLFITLEMSPIALGARSLLYISETPEEHWRVSLSRLDSDVSHYQSGRAPCYILDSVREAEEIEQAIEKFVADHGVQCVVIDYVQLIQGRGNGTYEQNSHVSKVLRRVTNKHSLVLLALAQLNREIEKRPKFMPKNSDLKDSGQWEQDADVILFLVWPHRLDPEKYPAHEYMIFAGKNRNRPIYNPVMKVNFLPSRQMLVAQEKPAYEEFDPFN